MRFGHTAAVALALLWAPGLAGAQQAGTDAPAATAPAAPAPEAPADPGTAPIHSPVLTIDPDRLFTGSRFGARVEREYEDNARKLAVENRSIEAELTAQERDLTDRRPKLAPEEFRKLADAFDAKVEGIRAAQAAKTGDLDRQREAERKLFLQNALPILGDLVRETGAVAVLNTQTIFLAFRSIDITDRAIQRIDETIGDGAQLEPAPGGDGAAPVTPAPGDGTGGVLPQVAPPTTPDTPAAPPATGN